MVKGKKSKNLIVEEGCVIETIIKEKLVSFKLMEEEIYAYVCEQACGMTRIILETYDDELVA